MDLFAKRILYFSGFVFYAIKRNKLNSKFEKGHCWRRARMRVSDADAAADADAESKTIGDKISKLRRAIQTSPFTTGDKCNLFLLIVILVLLPFWSRHNSQPGEYPGAIPANITNVEATKIACTEDIHAVVYAFNKEVILGGYEPGRICYSAALTLKYGDERLCYNISKVISYVSMEGILSTRISKRARRRTVRLSADDPSQCDIIYKNERDDYDDVSIAIAVAATPGQFAMAAFDKERKFKPETVNWALYYAGIACYLLLIIRLTILQKQQLQGMLAELMTKKRGLPV